MKKILWTMLWWLFQFSVSINYPVWLYLLFAISVRELIEWVQKRKPGILTPSEEWVRLQFYPENLQHKSSFKHTGRFNINTWFNRDKYQVSILIQSTLMCITHTWNLEKMQFQLFLTIRLQYLQEHHCTQYQQMLEHIIDLLG